MLLDPVSPAEMQTAQLLAGATMAAFIASPLLRGRAQSARVAIAVIYILAVFIFLVYYTW